MSREAHEAVIRDYETFDHEEAYGDRICVYEVSKEVEGKFLLEQRDAQDCGRPRCRTLKQAGSFDARLGSGPCDSKASAEALNGRMGGPFVTVYQDGDTTNRGGQTGRFQWRDGETGLLGRMRGIVNAGTHHSPVGACEDCHIVNHVEGWMRAAVTDGPHKGCRVAAMYALKLDDEGGFVGTIEGLLVCQCE